MATEECHALSGQRKFSMLKFSRNRELLQTVGKRKVEYFASFFSTKTRASSIIEQYRRKTTNKMISILIKETVEQYLSVSKKYAKLLQPINVLSISKDIFFYC